jgi:TonB-linked SusC/RagA family outer membrane protein
MKKIVLLLAFFAIGLNVLLAQTKEITGKVSSADDGSALPGVSVSVKGTTLGTITDGNGAFSLKVPQDAKTLSFTFVGMTTQEVAIGSQTSFQIKMVSEDIAVDEVVVTALGISRDKKSLSYSVQAVDGEEVNKVKGDNFVTSLAGRVSGIQVKNSTNFGGSTNVVIRGSSSLTGNNQALFVVDGIPVDNSVTNNSGQRTGRNGYDYGNAAADINPNDIESISVLKGAAATALYGSRAANGVILVTTKKGKATGSKAPVVSLSTNFTMNTYDKSTFPKYQTESGAGYGKAYYSAGAYPGFENYGDVDGDGKVDYTVPYYEDGSRGQEFDANVKVFQWDALYPESPNYMKATPWVASPNDAGTFFETGLSTSNTLEVAGGDDKTTYRFSYTYFDQKGIMPNSQLTKNNATFSGSHKILDNLKMSTSVNYVNTAGLGRPSTGYSDNIMSSFRQWSQTNVDYGLQKSLYESTKRNLSWNPVAYDDLAPAYWDNPYWVRNENYETDGRNRLIGYAQLDWDITSNLKFMGRYAVDTYNELQEERKAVGSGAGEFGVGRADVTSGYSRYTRDFTETNFDMLLTFHKKFTEKFDINALVGSNIRRTKAESVFASTNNGLSVARVYALSNSVDPMLPPEESFARVGVNGIFGSVSLGYDDTYFLDATLRRDQSSTLPAENNAYMYPSISGSVLFSNLIDADWLSSGKLRLNYAEVGSSAPALSVLDVYLANAPLSGNSLVTVPNTKNNADLKPERQKAMEGGLEMSFLKKRVGFDLSVYKENTIDQLMPVSISYATGFSSKWVNAGEIQNKGIELSLFGTPVKTADFSWDVKLNWSKNENEVISLYTDESGNEVTNLVLGSLQGGVTINATVGQPYGTIKGSDYQYHATNGGKLVNPANGRYLKTTTNDKVIGDVNPDFNAGLFNSLKYKSFTFSFLIDWQKGGDVFSLDLWYGMGTGLYAETAGLNDLGNKKRDAIKWVDAADKTKGYDPKSGGTINPGVINNPGKADDGAENWYRVSNETYGAIGWAVDPNARFVYDASYVKLREVVLSYDLPKSLISKLYLSNASFGIVASNVWIISKNLPHADPEASQSAGNIQGWQSGVMPATRNLGFTLNLQF